MSLVNSALPDFRVIELNTLALGILRNSTVNARSKMPEILMSLSSLSFGEFTYLMSVSPHL